MDLTWSSIVDKYCEVCLRASKDDSAFSVFRADPIYKQVVEHSTKELGRGYYDIIKRDNPWLIGQFYKFYTIDNFGSPLIYIYEDILASPSTLRYIKILSDLIKLFGDLSGFKIMEIGGGYGGQCKIIKDIFDVDYSIVDLPEVNLLTEKFLHKTDTKDVKFYTWDTLVKDNYDLVIAVGSFTEMNREIQDYYNDMIIRGSDRGYMIGSIELNPNNCYQLEDLKKMGKVNFVDEEPNTHPTNFVMYWNE